MKAELTNNKAAEPFAELEQAVRVALETYSNVHRGSGQNSIVSTRLYEQARAIVLEHLGRDPRDYDVVFCTPRRADALAMRLDRRSYDVVSSDEIGLPIGVRALVVERAALRKAVPCETGGGTARLVSVGSVVWAQAPDRFEAGTPALVNVIAFARALGLTRRFGDAAFRDSAAEELSAARIVREDDLDAFSGRELLRELRKTLIGRDRLVPTAQGARPYINLDNGASTPTFEPVFDAFCQAWRQPVQSRPAIVAEVRSVCAAMLGAPPADYDVIFTSNTTEAINLVAESLGNSPETGDGPVVVNTILEHNSNELPWRAVPDATLIRLPVNDDGFIDLAELESVLREHNETGDGRRRVRLVAVSGASNVLGVYNDLPAISKIVHRYGARLLVDAAQLVAHRKVSMEACGIDYLAFSAHKAYAPFGTGALVARKGLLDFTSAEMDKIRSSGEENTAGIAALGKALVLLQRIGLDVVQAEERVLTERALLGMSRVPGLTVYGIKDPDSPEFAHKGGVIPFGMKGASPHQVARLLAARGGIGVRSGCHCAHLLVKRLLGIPPWAQQLQRVVVTLFRRVELPGVIRVSLGIENSEDDIDTLIGVLATIASQPTSRVDQQPAPLLADKDVQGRIDDFSAAASREVYAQA